MSREKLTVTSLGFDGGIACVAARDSQCVASVAAS